MARRAGRNFLHVVWKDEGTRRRFVIGELSKNGNYEFTYKIENLVEAKKYGFRSLTAFPVEGKKYVSENLFPAFTSRLPDKRRADINIILKKYGLKKYDSYELLRKTGGKLPIDTLEFIDPIFIENIDKNSIIKRDFYIAGTKYYDLCDKKGPDDCNIVVDIKINDKLILVNESSNKIDSFAVRVDTRNGIEIGYVPSYYCKQIFNANKMGFNIKCSVIKIEKVTCQECIKIRIEISI